MFLRYALVLVLLLTIVQSEVVVLGDDNITDFISNHKYILIQFYAPWCGHCKALAPQYEKLPELVKEWGVQVAKVDATQAQKAADQYNVQGYPTLIFINNGVSVDYDGQRNAEGMKTWIRKVLDAKVQTKTEEQITALLGTKEIVVLRSDKQDFINSFTAAAFSLGLDCYHVSSTDNTITLYDQNKEAKKWQGLKEKLNVKLLKNWAITQTLPIIIPSSNEKFSNYIFNGYQGDLILVVEGKKVSEAALQVITAFCKNNGEIVKCMSVAASDQIFQGVINFLKLENNVQHALGFIKAGFKQGYTYTQSFEGLTEQTIKTWTESIASGKAESVVGGAQEIKYKQVVSLDNENFDKYIKENQYILVEFYSPDCGHCKQFSKDYEKFAQKLNSQNSQFKIAAVNVFQNKELSQKYKIQGYPTFIFFMNGKSVTYDGARSGTAMEQFMKQTINAKLQVAGSINQVPSPAVVIYDSAENSQLTLLSISFKRYPIYQIKQGETVRVQFKGEETQQYTGQVTIQNIKKWLFKITSPVLLNFSTMQVDPALTAAIQEGIPLLILVQNTEAQRERIEQQATKLCKELKGKLLCGYTKSESQLHQNILQWLSQKDKTNNYIYYVSLSKGQDKIRYSKQSITHEGLKAFIDESQQNFKKSQKEEEKNTQPQQNNPEKTVETEQNTQKEAQSESQDKQSTDEQQNSNGSDL